MGNKAFRIAGIFAFAIIFLSVDLKTVEANGIFSHEKECKKWEYYSFGHCHRPKPPAPTLTLTAIPTTIVRGATSTLSWTSTNAESCFASGVWKGWKKLDGEKTVLPRKTSIYKLTCFGKGGKVSERVTIKVTKATTTPPVLDVCPNIDGVQEEIPTGYHIKGENCVIDTTEPIDVCPNLPDIQETLPSGYEITDEECVPITPPPPTDVCPNLPDVQETIPSGYHLDGENCVEDVIPPIDVCPNINGLQGTLPSGYHFEGVNCVEDVVPPIDVCPNIEGVQETVPTDYHLDGENCVRDMPPPPATDHIVISEVYYDTNTAHGSDPANEWVEIYNGTGNPVLLEGWTIGDASGTDTIPTTTIASGEFIIITGTTTTAGLWSIAPNKVLVLTNSTIGSGLNNGGDAVYLRNGLVIIDSMSYGTNSSVFPASLLTPSDGHSFERVNPDVDTDTSIDWQDQTTPTPSTPPIVAPI